MYKNEMKSLNVSLIIVMCTVLNNFDSCVSFSKMNKIYKHILQGIRLSLLEKRIFLTFKIYIIIHVLTFYTDPMQI